MMPKCTHPDLAFVVFDSAVFVRCDVCHVRNRFWMGGESKNAFTLSDARAVLDGQGGDLRLQTKCRYGNCSQYAHPGSTFCTQHAMERGEVL